MTYKVGDRVWFNGMKLVVSYTYQNEYMLFIGGTFLVFNFQIKPIIRVKDGVVYDNS